MAKAEPYVAGRDAGVLSANSPLDGLPDCYEVQDAPRVQRFLQANPYLLPLLQEAPTYIARHFPDAPLTLEAENDPESGPQDDQLVVRIVTTLDAAPAVACLKQFDKEWWIGRVRASRSKLLITIEFR